MGKGKLTYDDYKKGIEVTGTFVVDLQKSMLREISDQGQTLATITVNLKRMVKQDNFADHTKTKKTIHELLKYIEESND